MSKDRMCKVMANEIIENLIGKGIRLLALDFDKTIVSVHTGGMWKGGTPKLVEEVRPCFVDLIEAALNNRADNLGLCIVTYSKQPGLIADLLKIVLPNRCVFESLRDFESKYKVCLWKNVVSFSKCMFINVLLF